MSPPTVNAYYNSANNEIVYATPDANGTGYIIKRASATGTNQRTITSLSFPMDGTSWGILSGDLPTPDKIWYQNNNNSSTAPKSKIYYISTTTVNAQGILVGTYSGNLYGTTQGMVANGSIALMSGCSGTSCSGGTPTYQTVSFPLPNGTTGTPPKFTDGLIFGGTVDGSTFYGTISNAPNDTPPQDAVVKCPTSNCTTPTIIARGQGNANYFTTDQSVARGNEILQALGGGTHYVVDTSRNGNGSDGSSCNPPGRKLGTPPARSTSPVDLQLWLRTPGEQSLLRTSAIRNVLKRSKEAYRQAVIAEDDLGCACQSPHLPIITGDLKFEGIRTLVGQALRAPLSYSVNVMRQYRSEPALKRWHKVVRLAEDTKHSPGPHQSI